MLPLVLITKLLHVFTAILLIGGLLGRGLTYAAAGRATDIHSAYALLQVSERFEKLMVRPGSELVLLFGLLLAWLERQSLLGVFVGGRANWLFVGLVLYLCTVPLAILVLLPRSKRRKQAAGSAWAQGQITPDLWAALGDKTVLIGRNVELLIILVVLSLMVLKPF